MKITDKHKRVAAELENVFRRLAYPSSTIENILAKNFPINDKLDINFQDPQKIN